MTPLRLFILAGLFYIGYRLLRSMVREHYKKAFAQEPQPDKKVEDVLVEDPVCHTLLPKQQAVRLIKDGKTYYFCSEECCETFTQKEKEEK